MRIEEFFLSLVTVMRAGLSPNLETQTSLQMEYPTINGMLYLGSKTPTTLGGEHTPGRNRRKLSSSLGAVACWVLVKHVHFIRGEGS